MKSQLIAKVVMSGFRSGHVAVVAGAGPIGLATIECLKALGAEKIIVVQRKSVRQEYALRAGADILLEPGKDDVVAEIYRLTGGVGADIAFETIIPFSLAATMSMLS